MDISGISSPAASSVARQKTGDAVGISVLNKAMDADVAAAAQLINSVVNQTPEVPSEKLDAHLGRNVDVQA